MLNRYRARKVGRVIIKPKVYTRSNARLDTNSTRTRNDQQDFGSTVACIRYTNNKACTFLSKAQFIEMMMERGRSSKWQNVSFIQNYIVTSHLMPEMFKYTFLAPLNINNPKSKIRYNLSNMQKEINSNQMLAQRFCTLMSYYIAEIHRIVLNYLKK